MSSNLKYTTISLWYHKGENYLCHTFTWCM